MSVSQERSPPRPYCRIAREDPTGSRLYRHARTTAVAAQIVQHLRHDAGTGATRCCTALYPCCRQTLRA
jgi:hypothetical protein